MTEYDCPVAALEVWELKKIIRNIVRECIAEEQMRLEGIKSTDIKEG